MQSLLGDQDHRLLSAAQAAKMAMVYSQYTALYVLTNAVSVSIFPEWCKLSLSCLRVCSNGSPSVQAAQGTSLLSYSFSAECPTALKQSFLLQAKEAFSIALLTKAHGEVVTSKQELHTFIRAAYSLTVTHKWLSTNLEDVLDNVMQICQKALAQFSSYDSESYDKDGLCAEIMKLISQVKVQLQVKPFLNSNYGSFIPDSYRNIKEFSSNFTPESFTQLLQRFQKYHASLCDTTHTKCRGSDQIGGERFCITALGMTVGTLNTECQTEARPPAKNLEQVKEAKQPRQDSRRQFELCATQDCTEEAQSLDSSWQKLSLSPSGSYKSSGYRGSSDIVQEDKFSNQSCVTTESDVDDSDNIPKSDDRQNNSKRNKLLVSSHKVMSSVTATTSSSSGSRGFAKLEVIQAGIETFGTEEDWVNVTSAMPQKPPGPEESAQHLSQLTPKTSSSSLSDSFTSQSSWEKVPTDFSYAPAKKPQPKIQSKVETSQTGRSSESDGSFFLLETVDCDCFDLACDPMQQNHTSQQEIRDSPQHLQGLGVEQVSVRAAPKKALMSLKPNPQLCASTEPSTESSFEFLVENQDERQTSNDNLKEKVNIAEMKNRLCFNCKHGTFANIANERQYQLSQQDYKALLAGVCHGCLLKRLHSEKSKFKLKEHQTAHSKWWVIAFCFDYWDLDYLPWERVTNHHFWHF